MNLNNIDLWNNIIYALNGTCDSLECALIHHSAEQLRDHEPFLHYLDNEIFLCDSCGWWCALSEMADNDNWECKNCSTSNEE